MRKKIYKKKRYNKSHVSKAVKKYVKKKIVKVGELKQLPLAFAAGVFPGTIMSTTVGNQYTFNQQPPSVGPGNQGVGGYQRLGNKISISYFEVKFNIQLIRNQVAQTTSGHEMFRCIIYVEKSPEGINTTSSEMLYDVANGLGTISPYIVNNRHRWTILHDKIYTLYSVDNTYPASGPMQHVEYKHYFKKPLITSYYNDTVATGIASVETNAIKMLLFASALNSGATGNQAPMYLAGSVYSSCSYRDA